MTHPSPTPAPTTAPAMRTTLRWDNLMILLIVLVSALLLVVGYLASIDDSAPDATERPSGETATATPTVAVDPNALTQLDAESLVEEARALMAEGRWVEAADRLATVPPEFADVVGASTLQVEFEQRRARHDGLRAQLVATVDQERWSDARVLLVELEQIAPLDAELLAIRATVDNHLLVATATAAQDTPKARPKTAREDGGRQAPSHHAAGGTGTTRPPAASTRPQDAERPTRPTDAPSDQGDSPIATPGASADANATSTPEELEAQLNAALIDTTP